MYEMATTTVLPHQCHPSFHLEVVGEKEKGTLIEFDGSCPGFGLVTVDPHIEVCADGIHR